MARLELERGTDVLLLETGDALLLEKSLSVTTQTCENIGATTATGRGNITVLGESSITAHGHCWNTSINPTTANDKVDNGAASSTGAFTSDITGLTPGTEYFTRAFATNTEGTAYGSNYRWTASLDNAGVIWMEGSNFHGFDENAIERKYIHTDDVDDVSVDGATTDPISSNWAYDHITDDGPHAGQTLDDTTQLNLTDPTELTISGGAVTVTQGSHTIDTEGDADEDHLNTINGGTTGDILIIKANNAARTIIVMHNAGNIQLREAEAFPSVHFASPTGSSGIFYTAGYYDAPAGEAVLTQGSTTVNHGAANVSEAAHLFVVAKGDGANISGDLVLTVTGISMNDQGTRNAADSEVVVADALLATFSTDTYMETTKKWLGQPTITLSSSGGGNFNCSFNYGFAKYNDFGNRKFHITDFEIVGRAGANDTGANFRLLWHRAADWTYSAAAFAPGAASGDASELANMNTDHSTDSNLATGKYFAFKRDNIDAHIDGADSEGVIVEITTGANKAVETMDIIFGGHVRPDHVRLDDTEQGMMVWYDGTNWLEL